MESTFSFKDYDGTYPNLCGGRLLFELNGEEVVFPVHCLYSGGSIRTDTEGKFHVNNDPWRIREFPEEFPEELRDRAIEIVNEKVTWGCCGGCLTKL